MSYLNPTQEDDYRVERMGMMNPATESPGASTREGAMTAIPKGVAGGLMKAQGLATAIGNAIDSSADAYLPSWLATYAHYAPFNPNAVSNAIPDDIRKRNENAREFIGQWAATGQDPRLTGSVGRSLSGAAQGLTVGTIGSAVGGPIGAAAHEAAACFLRTGTAG